MRKVKRAASDLNELKTGVQTTAPAPVAEEQKTATDNEAAVPVREYTIEYDAEQLDEVVVRKMRAQAGRCKVEGGLVEGLFRTRTNTLNFAEIDAAADHLSQTAAALRHLVTLARVGAAILILACVTGCCDGEQRESVNASSTVNSRPACQDGHCDFK